MKKENWDFNEALRYLSERAGVTLRAIETTPPEEEQALQRLRDLLENAVTFYQHHLTQTPEGRQALDYLHKRGLRDETILQFGLGYAPNRWDALLNYFLDKGYSPDDLFFPFSAARRIPPAPAGLTVPGSAPGARSCQKADCIYGALF